MSGFKVKNYNKENQILKHYNLNDYLKKNTLNKLIVKKIKQKF